MIEIDEISKTYGQQKVLDQLSLRIDKGGIVSIIGSNGAGKSTLLTIISRMTKCDFGKISVDGLDIFSTNSSILAKKLSILRQDNHLSMRLSVRDLISFGRYPYSKGRLNDHDKKYIDSALRYLDLEALEDRFIDELSGGQRQRAFVAMVVCQDTDYVLLDEPLNNLDMKHSVAMMKQLRRTADELGKTILMVMHDINFASCYSDRIIALKDGRLCYYGLPSEIITPAVLYDIYGMEIKVETIAGQKIALYYQ
ncbi:ABC transporter ATP-binding protein [Bartonella sp. DGB2]|uniref:iron ABC transporter ATP-binding protein n=1 Tax=Bartonella sp. DGB2 TaxID=3388426 RepID=UPI0039902A7B